jgi:hypothetical protein
MASIDISANSPTGAKRSNAHSPGAGKRFVIPALRAGIDNLNLEYVLKSVLMCPERYLYWQVMSN